MGLWLGAAFTICFVTGLLSHLHQNAISWLPIPTGPAWGYRLTQGVHVASGTASVPLLLAKLYAAYPRLFTRPVVGSPVQMLERASIRCSSAPRSSWSRRASPTWLAGMCSGSVSPRSTSPSPGSPSVRSPCTSPSSSRPSVTPCRLRVTPSRRSRAVVPSSSARWLWQLVRSCSRSARPCLCSTGCRCCARVGRGPARLVSRSTAPQSRRRSRRTSTRQWVTRTGQSSCAVRTANDV